MKEWGIMLKQYELLRHEIVQCINLRQLAIVGIFTSILAGLGVLITQGAAVSQIAKSGALPFVAIGVAFLVNAFGSLYLHEQHRNRRACIFNLAIERLLTKLACRAAGTQVVPAGAAEATPKKCFPVIAWENFLTLSKTCKKLNTPFYKARYLGVGLPILVFSAPILTLTLVGYSPHGNIGDPFWRLMLFGLSAASVCALMARAFRHASRAGQVQGGKPSTCSVVCLGTLYVAPILIVVGLLGQAIITKADYPLSGLPEETAAGLFGVGASWSLFLMAAAVSVVLAIWTLFVFFHIMRWLGEDKKVTVKHVFDWIAEYCKKVDDANTVDDLGVNWPPF